MKRRHDLDALRALAMLFGLALHAALSFVGFTWVVQDPESHLGFGVFVHAVHGFRMPLFFLISGFFTAMLWRTRGLSGLIRQRLHRIVLPLLLGMATVVPVTWGIIYVAKTSAPKAQQAKHDLWNCAAEGRLEGLERHLQVGEDLNASDPVHHLTPLAWAVIGNQVEAVDILLEKGADPGARYKDFNTALHTAAFLGRAECAARLLEAGARIEARNVHGLTPYDVLKIDMATTELIAGFPLDAAKVTEGRRQIAQMLEGRGVPASMTNGARNWLAILMFFPFFHHLWFLWYLCLLVTGFAFVVWAGRKLRLRGLPKGWVRLPARWLWIVPVTMLPQYAMHGWGKAPNFGADLSAGLLPMPHVLLFYAIFFAFGALYFTSEDEEGRLGRVWWLNLLLGLVVLPFSLAFSLHLTGKEMDPQLHHIVATTLEVLYVWLMIFGLMGLFRRWLSKERCAIRYVSDASYWLYLAHLPLILLAQVLVRPWPLPAFVKFGIVLAGVTFPLMVIYRYAVRYRWLGRLLNGPRTR